MFDIIKKSVLFVSILSFITDCSAIRCYQCSSNTDPEGTDLCGAYNKFDTERNIASDCYSEDSKVPGTFCVKIVQQSPIGFIWDGRWRQVIRRCASVSSTGVTGVCNWGVYENGVYWEECYCSEDACNRSPNLYGPTTTYICLLSAVLAFLINKR